MVTIFPTLSIVVPVYNSEQSLPELVSRIASALLPQENKIELILVNDGSRDGSWEVIKVLAAHHPWVRGINHMRNYGQHNALLTGILDAKNEVIITMDDDLQHPPEEISKLLAKLHEGYDVVYGIPEERKHGAGKNLGSCVLRWMLQTFMGANLASNFSPFRAIRKEICVSLQHYKSDYVFLDAILPWATTRFGYVTIQHNNRKYGTTNYTLRRNLKLALSAITGFSIVPLQIASLLGFFFMIFGGGLFIYVVLNYITHDALQGFTFIAATIALFSGVQLFCLGIIGAYLARIHLRNMGKPIALIREKTK